MALKKNYNIGFFLGGGGGIYCLQSRQFVYIKIYKNNKFLFKMMYIYIYIHTRARV